MYIYIYTYITIYIYIYMLYIYIYTYITNRTRPLFIYYNILLESYTIDYAIQYTTTFICYTMFICYTIYYKATRMITTASAPLRRTLPSTFEPVCVGTPEGYKTGAQIPWLKLGLEASARDRVCKSSGCVCFKGVISIA